MKTKRSPTNGKQPIERTPKKTRQGNGTRSKPSHGRKKSVGQGR